MCSEHWDIVFAKPKKKKRALLVVSSTIPLWLDLFMYHTSAISLLVSKIWATGCDRWANRLSQRLISRHWPIAANAYWHCINVRMLKLESGLYWSGLACSWARCLGRLATSIRRRPTPIAPEETMTTLWPSFRSLTAVSTIRVKIGSRGSWVVSSTIELVPWFAEMLERTTLFFFIQFPG